MRHKCWVYNQSWLQDSDLWEQFKEDFDKWTAQLFDEVNKTHLRNLRSALRKYGVWVHKSNRPPKLNDALYKCLQEEEPTAWTILEIQQTIPKDGEFKSNLIAYMLKTGGVEVRVGNLNDVERQPAQHQNLPPPLSPADRAARDIVSLTKLITVDNKYSGQNDNFDIKLNIFENYCKQLNITDDTTKAKAYSNMLKDDALNHFFANQVSYGGSIPTFAQLCGATRAYFENDDHRRSQLQLFNSLTLKEVISRPENTAKQKKECLNILVGDLRKAQNGADETVKGRVVLDNANKRA